MKMPSQRKRGIAPPTIVSLLGMRAEQQARRVAYTFISDSCEQKITYAGLDRRAWSIAHMLAELQMQGKRIVLIYPPGIEYIAAFYGCLYAGAIAVPVCPPDPLRLDRSLRHFIAVVRDAMPSAVLTTAAMAAALAEPDRIDTDSVALLQYTSGSAAGPKGVVLTHRHLMSSSELIFGFPGHSTESRGVSWLPPCHGMGLIGGIIQPLYGGYPAALMAPADFMRRAAFHPCYGLAEATVIAVGGIPWCGRSTKSFDVTALRSGTAVTVARTASSRRLVSSGLAATGRQVVIVDPATAVECAPGRVGEIWIARCVLALSYWRRPAETRETFAARLADTGEGPFIRSGDLGFVLDQQLFVTGRIEDLIVVRGSRHHPQDIEATAELSSQLLRRGCSAAFTVPAGGRERLVIAYEITRQAGQVNVADVAGAIRAAVAAEHEVQVHRVILLPPGGIPKTSDGKIQRGLCAARFADGRLAELVRNAPGAPGGNQVSDLHQDEPALLAPAVADQARSATSDRDTVRHYCWVSGSRVPVHAAGPVSC